MEIKLPAKRAFQRSLPSNYAPLLVASFGRAGSTLVFNALVDGMARARLGWVNAFSRKLVHNSAWDIASTRFSPGVVYKTHDYPQALGPDSPVRAIYMFGSTLDSALSVYGLMERKGPAWIARHFSRLKSDAKFDELLQSDVLGLMEQSRAWTGFEAIPVLCLRYDAIWDYRKELAEFCGYEISLPERRARETKFYDSATLEAARMVYDPLDAILDRLPDCFMAQQQFARTLDNASVSPTQRRMT